MAWSKRTYSRWAEILQLMVGVLVHAYHRKGIKQALHWVNHLIKQRGSEEGDPGNLGLLLALQSFSEASVPQSRYWKEEGAEEMEKAIVLSWLDTLFEEVKHQQSEYEPDSLLWKTASLHLSETARKVLVEHLTGALGNEDWQIRKCAVQVWAKVRESISVEQLLTILHDTSHTVRLAGVPLLANLGKHLTIECFLQCLVHEDRSVRDNAISTLARQLEPTFLEHLLLQLPSSGWRIDASRAQLLAQLGKPVAIDAFLNELQEENIERREAALQVLGTTREPVPIEPLLIALSDEDFNVRHIAIWAIQQKKEQLSEEMLKGIYQSKDPMIRSSALEIWGSLDKEIPGELLMESVRNGDSFIRIGAAQALSQRKESVPAELLRELLQDVDDSVRFWAARALAQSQLPLESLREAVQSEDQFVCSRVLQALWHQGESTLVEAFLTRSGEDYIWMRVIALELLSLLKHKIPVELLLEALHDQHHSVRAAATWALGKLGGGVAIEPLTVALQDNHWQVRWVAVQALGQLGKSAPIEQIQHITQDQDERVRNAAFAMLFRLRQHHLLPPNSSFGSGYGGYRGYTDRPIEWAFYYHNSSDRAEPSQQKDEEWLQEDYASAQELFTALKSNQGKIRRKAEEKLESLGKQGALESVLLALEDESPSVQAQVIAFLGQLGKDAPVEVLVRFLNHTHLRVRLSALKALGQLGKDAPVELLLIALRDEDVTIRRTALQMLGHMGDPISMDYLLLALQDQREDIRGEALYALGSMEAPLSSEVLFTALGDWHKEVRGAAATTIQRMYPQIQQEATSEMIGFLQHRRPGFILRSIAYAFIADTIGSLTSPSPLLLEKLTQLLYWPHWAIRMKAAQAIGNIRRTIPDAAVYNTVNIGHMLVADLASSVGLLQIVSQKSEPHLCSIAWIRSGWHGFFALSPAAESGRFLTNKITKGGQRWQTCLTIILEPGGRKLQCGKQQPSIDCSNCDMTHNREQFVWLPIRR